jgi:hypothetical protein
MRREMRIFLATLVMVTLSKTTVEAEELINQGRPHLINPHLICNTPEQALAFPNGTVKKWGCQFLTGLWLAQVDVLSQFEHDGIAYNLVRYTFIMPGMRPEIRYGFWTVTQPEGELT